MKLNTRVFKRPVVLAAAVVVAAATGTGVTYAAGWWGHGSLTDQTVGQQPDGSYLTQTNQFVTPAGDVIKVTGRPFGLALSPDGKTAAALNTGGATSGIVTIFDLVNHKVLEQAGKGGISDGGVLYAADGKSLWAARPGDLQRFPVNPDGTVGNPVTVALPGVSGRKAVPAGLALAPNGNLLVTLSGNNTLGVVDTTTNTLVSQIPVGNVPNSVAVIDGVAYVSNQGGRPAQPGDRTDNSYGTPIVTNDNSAVPSTGTVSEVDLSAGREIRTFPVGLEPSALLAVGKNLLVTNTDDDTVSTIDTVRQQVARTFVANPAPGAPFGAQPNGLTQLDPTHIAVSLGRDNAVAVYDFQDAYSAPAFEGLIPTGSFPTGIAQDTALGRLVVASEQGLGSVGPNGTVGEGTGTGPATAHLGYNFVGTVQTVATPDPVQMVKYTEQVFQNNQWISLFSHANQRADNHARPVPVPMRVGDPSTIQHVFLIVKENRTYDQVFGDDPRGNGDPSLAQFGRTITPNLHALAGTFPLIDNVYSDGTNSAEGHHWLDQAFVNNYMQQMYGNYTRSYQAGDPLSDVKSGWIWDNAAAHGRSVANWGEQIANYSDANGNGSASGSWTKWLHDSQVLDGSASGPLNYPLGSYTAKTDIPSLQQITKPDFPNFDLNIPDQYRAAMFGNDFAQYVRNNNLPALNLMWVMSDHTEGTSPGGITPEAHVADNDLAVGRIVDQISHSRYWANSAIFVIEDDSQNGVDHVDGHRNPTLVISPYARRGAVVHTYYSQVNVMRTIEQILGLPPMNQEDMTAQPMYDVFTNRPDFTPYTHVASNISLTETNPQPAAAAGAVQAAWAKWSAAQNWKTEDMVNMAQGNRDVWYASNNFTVPYPGDSKVLLPNEVPGAGGTQPPAPDGDN